MHVVMSLGVFVAAYTLNMTYISVFYHRALAHGAVGLRPGMRRFVVATGSWITGLDVAGWVCMHRMHHAYADQPDDPHSPANVGVVGVALAQLKSYERVLSGLARHDERYERFVRDLGLGVGALNRLRLWWLPYVAHALVATALSVGTDVWMVGPAYFVGLMSHPVQGWLVNSFGHRTGGRTFATRDDSRNNLLVALFVFGEGLQNNHHAYPRSARFSYRWWEPDAGWLICRALSALRMLEIRPEGLVPTARGGSPAASAHRPAEHRGRVLDAWH